MKLALALAAAALLSVGAMGGLVAWRDAHPSDREQELRWLESYVAWTTEIDNALERGEDAQAVGCERRLHELAGRPPTPTLTGAMEAALAGCRTLRRSIAEAEAEVALPDYVVDDWYGTRDRVLGKVIAERERSVRPARSDLLARQVASLAGTTLTVLCWPEDDWEALSEQWRLVRGDDFWLAGYADWTRDRIHLAPTVCRPLTLFFGGSYAPNLNLQSYELAEALATLAHEAEHLRSPDASEAEVECVALQRVRDLVEAAGRPRSYQVMMAGLAWDVGYPANLPQYKTNFCRDGGPLDVRPRSDVWP